MRVRSCVRSCGWVRVGASECVGVRACVRVGGWVGCVSVCTYAQARVVCVHALSMRVYTCVREGRGGAGTPRGGRYILYDAPWPWGRYKYKYIPEGRRMRAEGMLCLPACLPSFLPGPRAYLVVPGGWGAGVYVHEDGEKGRRKKENRAIVFRFRFRGARAAGPGRSCSHAPPIHPSFLPRRTGELPGRNG